MAAINRGKSKRPRGQEARGWCDQGSHYVELGSQGHNQYPGLGVKQGHKPKPQSLCLKKWNSNTELLGKVLATQRTPWMCSEATGPEHSCMGREQDTEVQGGTESRREDPALSTSVPACGKSRVEESGGAQPGQHQQHPSSQGQEGGWRV